MIAVAAPADPLAAVTHPDPYPYYDDLARNRPLYFDEPLWGWVASSADAVSTQLTHDAFRVRPSDELVPSALRESVAGELFRRFVRTTDGAYHDRMKPVVSECLHALDLGRVAAITRSCTASLFAGLGRPPDWRRFTREFAIPLPAHVMIRLLGVEESAAAEVSGWVQDFVRGLSPIATPHEVMRGKLAAERLTAALTGMNGFIAGLSGAARPATPDDPLCGLANAIGVLFQSVEGTTATIGNALVALSRHARAGEEIACDSRSIATVVETVVTAG